MAAPRARETANTSIEIRSDYEIRAPQRQLWDSLTSAQFLAVSIPGCEYLRPRGADRYDVKLSVGAGKVTAVFDGSVTLVDPIPPERFGLSVLGTSAFGSVEGTAKIALERAERGVRVHYIWTIRVQGALGQLGRPFVRTIAEWYAKEFFTGVAARLEQTVM